VPEGNEIKIPWRRKKKSCMAAISVICPTTPHRTLLFCCTTAPLTPVIVWHTVRLRASFSEREESD